MGAAYSSATLPNPVTNPLFWAVWGQVVLNNSLMLFVFGFGVWACFSRCSFGRSRGGVVAAMQLLVGLAAAATLLFASSRPPDNSAPLPVFLSIPVVATLLMTMGLAPYLRSLRLEVGQLVKNRITLTLASMASAMFIASLFSGLIMQLYFKSSISQRVLIRLFLFPLLVEVMLLAVRAVARSAFGPGVAAQNTLLFLLPPMLTASLVGRFLSTNLESIQETAAVSVAVASVEMLLRFTLPIRDSAVQHLRRCLCCAAPLHESGTAQGRLSAAWEQRRWSHFHFAFMEMDSMCEDVGVLLALPITLLFAMPPAPGAAPLGAGAVLLRVLVQLLIESGTDLSAAWGAVFLRWACGLSLRPVRVSRLVNDHLQLPRLQNSSISVDDNGVLNLAPAAKAGVRASATAKRLGPAVPAQAAAPSATGGEGVQQLGVKAAPHSPHGQGSKAGMMSLSTPSHSLELRSPRPLDTQRLLEGGRSPPTADNPVAEQASVSLSSAVADVEADPNRSFAYKVPAVPAVSLPPVHEGRGPEAQLTPACTPSAADFQMQDKAGHRDNCLRLVWDSFALEWGSFAQGPREPAVQASQCCAAARQGCRLFHGCGATAGDIEVRTAAGVQLEEMFLREAQVERASLWQHLPLHTIAESALGHNAKRFPAQEVAIDDSSSHAEIQTSDGSARLRSLPALKRWSLLLSLRFEAMAVKRMYAWDLLPPGLRVYFVLAVLGAAVSVVQHSFNTQLRCAYSLPGGGYKFDFCTGL